MLNRRDDDLRDNRTAHNFHLEQERIGFNPMNVAQFSLSLYCLLEYFLSICYHAQVDINPAQKMQFRPVKFYLMSLCVS